MMNAFLIVVDVNAVMLGFGLKFAGYVTLMAPSEEENEEMHRNYREARVRKAGCTRSHFHSTTQRGRR